MLEKTSLFGLVCSRVRLTRNNNNKEGEKSNTVGVAMKLDLRIIFIAVASSKRDTELTSSHSDLFTLHAFVWHGNRVLSGWC